MTHCLRLNLQLHTISLVRTCRISSFCTVAWQLARLLLTRRIARSLGNSWASCLLDVWMALPVQRQPSLGFVPVSDMPVTAGQVYASHLHLQCLGVDATINKRHRTKHKTDSLYSKLIMLLHKKCRILNTSKIQYAPQNSVCVIFVQFSAQPMGTRIRYVNASIIHSFSFGIWPVPTKTQKKTKQETKSCSSNCYGFTLYLAV